MQIENWRNLAIQKQGKVTPKLFLVNILMEISWTEFLNFKNIP